MNRRTATLLLSAASMSTLGISSTATDFEVRLTFADSGRGISTANMSNLFQPFFPTRKSGTGLGLLIVRRIVREHGGEIEIESRESEGTKVTVSLPLAEKNMRLLQAPPAEMIDAAQPGSQAAKA